MDIIIIMRVLLIIILSSFSLSNFAQLNPNYHLKDRLLSWSYVFESDLSKQEIQSILHADPLLNPMATNFTGQSIPTRLKCDDPVAIYFEAPLSFFANIQVKAGRYKVEISNITLFPTYTINIGSVQTSNNPEAFERYLVKNNHAELRTGSLHQTALDCLDAYLLEKFKFQEISLQNNDW